MSGIEPTLSNPLFARLEELERETDAEFVIELIDIFLMETPKQIKSIADGLHSQSFPALMIAAHTLKGSSLNLGAKQLGALCLKLEEIGRAAQSIPANTNTKEIEDEFENVRKELNTYKETHAH